MNEKVKEMMTLRRPFLLLLFILLSAVMLLTGVNEYQFRRDSALQMMSHMSHSLSISIRQGTESTILLYDKVLEETELRMLAALRRADRETPDPGKLRTICRENGLLSILVYNRQGNCLAGSNDTLPPLLVSPDLFYLASSPGEWAVPDIRQPEGDRGRRYILALGRKSGGILEARIDAAELSRIQKDRGIASLLNSVIRDSSITYIAIQDSLGIIAASHNVNELSSLATDPFLKNVLNSGIFSYRLTSFQSQPVYEGVMPFTVQNTPYGLIRIGLDAGPIREISRAALRNALFRFGLILIISFILIAYSVLIQNHRLLSHEKDRMTREVFTLQEDLRRREKLSAMGELAAGVAHEIRNPLNAMSLAAQRLLKRLNADQNETEKTLVLSMRQEIRRLDTIIRQFLDFARPAPLNPQPTRLLSLINSVKDLYAAKMESRQIRLNISCPESIVAGLDPDKIRQVLVNLLENSLQAMENNGTISIDVRSTGTRLTLTLSDSGRGIPADILPKIFNLYFTTKSTGNGLGLPEVQRIISEHQGHIQVESREGSGTVFTLDLPA